MWQCGVWKRSVTAWVIGWCVGNAALLSLACPFCPPSSPPFAELMAESDQAALVKWVRSHPAVDDLSDAQTEFQIVEALKQHNGKPQVGAAFRVPYLLEGKPGDLFLVMGQQVEELTDWRLPVEVTEISYAYVKQAPSPEKPMRERLPYFLKFLQFSDPTVANDAFAEFSRAPYADVAALRDKLSPATIRRWMRELPPAEQMRIGFYGLLLGLCGSMDDAAYLEQEVLRPTPDNEVRLGLDGMMGGYVLLTGETGLQRLLQAKLDTPDQPEGDIYALVNALRFLWEFAPEQVPRTQIETAMASLIERPAFAEVALGDLARWGHWQVTERVLMQYGQPPFDDPRARHQLIHFALACIRAAERNPNQPLPQAEIARKFLKQLEQTDPEALRNAKRFFTTRPDATPAE